MTLRSLGVAFSLALCLAGSALGGRAVAAQEADPIVLVRLTPAVVGWFADPNLLLREEPLAMVKYDSGTDKLIPTAPANNCVELAEKQADGFYTETTVDMARETVISDICRLGQRYKAATFEETAAPKHTLHADVLELWSAWFQLAVSSNVADAVEEAVGRGVSLGAFQEPSVEGCGPRAVERKDPWTITAANNCDGLYLSVVGEEYTASGKMRPIVFYHMNATGGSLRVGGYTAVAPHPATGVWTPLQFLER
ncbi:MAG: hypothetical protein P1U88_01640 [Thalassobaculaceae bacterium]|nr:hypothetical protein [Thalassobaculaceae bacterium]